MKTKLTDSYGNDQLDENGCVQYVPMKKYEVTFSDTFEASNEDNCFDKVLFYLTECINNGDVTAFNFKELKETPRPAQMTNNDLIKTVQSLLNALEDNCLSPEDFMHRLNNTYNHFGQVTHENHHASCPQCGFDEIDEHDLSDNKENYICGECGYEDVKGAF